MDDNVLSMGINGSLMAIHGYQWVTNGYHGSLITPIFEDETQFLSMYQEKVTCPFGHDSDRNMCLALVR